MTQTISWTQQCADCKGIGLYQGMGEREGASVVCKSCRGTGEQHFTKEYEPFAGRRKPVGITQVYQTNPGIMLANDIVPGGVSIEQWLEEPDSPQQAGAEMREHTCPAWWYQGANFSLQPQWSECRKSMKFSDCPSFAKKEKCWERWDREQPGQIENPANQE